VSRNKCWATVRKESRETHFFLKHLAGRSAKSGCRAPLHSQACQELQLKISAELLCLPCSALHQGWGRMENPRQDNETGAWRVLEKLVELTFCLGSFSITPAYFQDSYPESSVSLLWITVKQIIMHLLEYPQKGHLT
jgi:hypothetical protein